MNTFGLIVAMTAWIVVLIMVGILVCLIKAFEKVTDNVTSQRQQTLEKVAEAFDSIRKTVNKGVKIKTNIGYEYRIDTVSVLSKLDQVEEDLLRSI